MFYSLEETLQIINENKDVTRDKPSTANQFTTKAQGIIIYDTFNNPFFPIQPIPNIDTAKLDLIDVFDRYRELYASFNPDFLPWHFTIEFVNNRYFVFNTRPLNLKFLLNNSEAIKHKDKLKIKWDDKTDKLVKSKLLNIQEMVHIAIVGNSNFDVYTSKMYSLLNHVCIRPIIQQNKLPEGLYQRIWPINLGKKFNANFIKSK